MKRVIKSFSVLAITLLMILSLAGCTNKFSTSNEPKGFTVTDSTGAKISFDNQPTKIISLLPSDTEILYGLNAQDKVIAVSKTSNYPKEASQKVQLDTGEKTNIEAIVGLKPDVVLISKMNQTQSQIKQLQDAGIKVVVTDPQNIAQAYEVIKVIGQICGKESAANDMVTSMQKDFDTIKQLAKGLQTKKVYFEISPLQFGLWTCGKGTFQQELMDICLLTNIFSNLHGWKAVSEEQVISKDPDVIITLTDASEVGKDPVQEIKSRKNWGNISAVKNNKVFMINADIMSRPSPRLVLGAKELMRVVYGK